MDAELEDDPTIIKKIKVEPVSIPIHREKFRDILREEREEEEKNQIPIVKPNHYFSLGKKTYSFKAHKVKKTKIKGESKIIRGIINVERAALKGTKKAAQATIKGTGKAAKFTLFTAPIQTFLAIVDGLSDQFGGMQGRDMNYPKLWRNGAIFVCLGIILAMVIQTVGKDMIRTYGLGNLGTGLIVGVGHLIIPGGLIFGGLMMILGGFRLQMGGKSFSKKFKLKYDAPPAFDTGVKFVLGKITMSLRDMHTNVGAFGGIGTGKGTEINACISTTYGSKTLKDIKKGDKVLSPTGEEETVLKIIYLGKQTLWHVQTEDGLLSKCTSDHLWYVKELKQDGEIITETGSLAELIQKGKTFLVQTQPSGFAWKKITNIQETTEVGECRCLILSGTEHLYVADGIVTHNCLDPEQTVIMYDGTLRKVKALKPGELLMGPDGKPRLIRVTSTGYGPLYRIIPIKGKGKPWICNDAHVMTLKYTSKNGSRPDRETVEGEKTKNHWKRKTHYKGISQVFGKVPNKKVGRYYQRHLEENNFRMDVPLKDFIARKAPSRSLDLFWKLFRPSEIKFPDLEDHDPSRSNYTHEALSQEEYYLAGAWIGDGLIASGWCNEDEAIKFAVKNYLSNLADNKRDFGIYIQNKDKPNFEIITPKGIGKGGAISNLEKYLLEFTTATNEHKSKGRNLSNMYARFKRQYDKDIPHWAMVAPSQKRLQLLAGILDTDGSYNEPCHCFDLTQKRLWILEKTVWLCRSLGLAACEPYESWKEATNSTKTLPTSQELEDDPTLLQDHVQRGLLKLGLHLEEKKISQTKHDELAKGFQNLLLEENIDSNKASSLQTLLFLHTSENRERYWRITISGDIHRIPTRVPHKQVNRLRAETRLDGRGFDHIDTRDAKDELCFGWDAEPIGDGPYCGFTLDGDGRFLLGDFTVTHNTVSVMIPLMRQFFRQLNHDDDPKNPKDELQKVGALILDEKGDFIDATLTEMLQAGRSIQDLVLIDPDLDLFRYNPLDPSQTASENAAKLAKVQKIIGGGSGGDNKFWDDTSKATIEYFLQLLEVYKPKEKIGLDDIGRFMRDDALATVLCDQVETTIETKKKAFEITEEAYGAISDAVSSVRNQWIELNPNTKSTLKTTIANMLGPIAANPRLQKVFCRDTNFSFKDLPNEGKIVLFRGSGIDKSTAKLICVCLKIDFQAWQKRRNGSTAGAFGLNKIRTVLFICDEYQEFVTCGGEGDDTFYGVSRSTRTCVIVATQSYNSLASAINNKEQCATLVQNITTWIFLRTTDKDTMELGNLWAGQSKQEDFSTSQNQTGFLEAASNLSGGGGGDKSINVSRKLEENFRKDDFSKLITMTFEKSRTGPWYSEAIIYHYHDTDADAESRCYKTELPHLYYDEKLKDKAEKNVRDLDLLLYDRNWQRKAYQRGLLLEGEEEERAELAKEAAAQTAKRYQEKQREQDQENSQNKEQKDKNQKIREKTIKELEGLKTEIQDTAGKPAGAFNESQEENIDTLRAQKETLEIKKKTADTEQEREQIGLEIGQIVAAIGKAKLMSVFHSQGKDQFKRREILEAEEDMEWIQKENKSMEDTTPKKLGDLEDESPKPSLEEELQSEEEKKEIEVQEENPSKNLPVENKANPEDFGEESDEESDEELETIGESEEVEDPEFSDEYLDNTDENPEIKDGEIDAIEGFDESDDLLEENDVIDPKEFQIPDDSET